MSLSSRPDPLVALRLTLQEFAPSPDALLRWLCPQLSDAMLMEIAVADYGMDRGDNVAALHHLRDTGLVPSPLLWVPKEVLELTRWSEPDDPTRESESQGERGHLIRAFCCTVLLRGAVDPANAGRFDGENQNVLRLIVSALVLGEAAIRGALQLFVWCLRDAPGPLYERPFVALGVLLLVVALHREQDERLLPTVCDWVMAEEAWAREKGTLGLTSDAWLLGLTFSDDTDTWREVVWRVLVEPLIPHSPIAVDALNAIATRLIIGFAD